tara:strand:- start:2046 stop:3116 length:1071 start_codon:yes stop_codon:yes gene_type:complete
MAPAPKASPAPATAPKTLLIACGALGREVIDIIRLNNLDHLTVTCLPAIWHNTPDKIPAGVREKIRSQGQAYDRILVAYGDCGTGGLLDHVLREEGAERIEGAHCYAFYSGLDAFEADAAANPQCFYLTDYLARHFDRLIIQGMGLDRFPELRDSYFGNYTHLVYLAQTRDGDLEDKARAAAAKIGLLYQYRYTGMGELAEFLLRPDDEAKSAQRDKKRRKGDSVDSLISDIPNLSEFVRPTASGAQRKRQRRSMAKMTILYWRDIPAQVVAKAGRKNAKVVLDERFEKAIDRAAMISKQRDTDSYLEHWRKGEPQTCDDEDLQAAADAEARRLEAEFTAEKLNAYVANGGLKPQG